MPDIFLYSSEDLPADLKLRDPTVAETTGAIVGTLAVTEAGDTLSATSKLLIKGAGGGLVEVDDASSSATLLTTSTTSLFEAADTVSASAKVLISSALAVTEAADSVEFTAHVVQTMGGFASMAEAGDTVLSTGAVAISARAILGRLLLRDAVSGLLLRDGASRLLLPSGGTEENDTLAAHAAVAIHGIATITDAGDAISAAGQTEQGLGLAAITEASDTATVTGALRISAQTYGEDYLTDDALERLTTDTGEFLTVETDAIVEADDAVSASATIAGTGVAAAAITEASDTVVATMLLSGVPGIAVVAVAAIVEDGDRVVATAIITAGRRRRGQGSMPLGYGQPTIAISPRRFRLRNRQMALMLRRDRDNRRRAG